MGMSVCSISDNSNKIKKMSLQYRLIYSALRLQSDMALLFISHVCFDFSPVS